ncbi:MAG TPA: hypothetical protein VGW79_03755 [Actinomycetota bacterium]|nr:hypothetical protein [Actinomycetota bacterium]
MYAAIWSAIGILAAALFGSIYFSDQRMDVGFARLETRMDQRFALVDERFARLEARMDQGFARMDSRLDAVNARLDAHIQPHTG